MSRWAAVIVFAGAVALAACGKEADESAMAGMTAEEHARMQAGGTAGAVDTTGAALREPVHLTAEEERALGVVYTVVRRGPLARTIRTVGGVQPPETGLTDITPKIDGFVDKLYVNFTGQTVRRGQALLSLYSPMLVSAQEELLTAKRLASQVDSTAGEAYARAQALLEAARRRLAYWDITPTQIARIERTGEVTKTLTLVAPFNGVVLEKMVVEGQQVMPGMKLYRLADLSSVWIEGEVFEQDLQFVHVRSQAHIEVTAYPGRHWMGEVSFVYPVVDERSRTNRIRVTVPNPGLELKPGMYATVYFDAQVGTDVLTVPIDAVVVTGERNVVFVRDEEGMLAPREVVLGPRGGDRVQVVRGLSEGETIVASANFLVDAESRLARGAGGMPGMAGMSEGEQEPAAAMKMDPKQTNGGKSAPDSQRSPEQRHD
jgi:Cu(I)/Ag(I) efflux system membrane fusion protein